MTSRVILAPLALFCCCAGCFSWTDYPLPAEPSRLVLNCLFTPDSIWKAHVSLSQSSIENRDTAQAVVDALVEIWENDTLLGRAVHAGEGVYYLNQHPAAGKQYRIKVSAPGYPAAEASGRIPQPPLNMSGEWELGTRSPQFDEYGGIYFTSPVRFRFTDPAGEANFYMLGMALSDSFTCYNPLTGDTFINPWDGVAFPFGTPVDDPFAEGIGKRNDVVLLRDLYFNGAERPITLYADSAGMFSVLCPGNEAEQRRSFVLYVDVWSLSEPLFSYVTTYLTQGFGVADPFATYTNTYNNIQNGFGIFAGYQRKQVFIYAN
jgi:hypothetical protein